MPEESKSVLGNVPVEEKGFPLHEGDRSSSYLTVVGHCPKCGLPIYGDSFIVGNDVPMVRRSCGCIAFEDSARTK